MSLTPQVASFPQLSRRVWIALILFAWLSVHAGGADEASAAVTLRNEPASFAMENGVLSVRIDKATGNLVSLKHRGLELLRSGRGYWSFAGGGARFGGPGEGEVRQDPATNGGAIAEVACHLLSSGQRGTLPCDVSIRYALGRGEHGLHAYSVWTHRPGQPPFSVGEARYAMKLDPAVFDYLTIDAHRRRLMPTGEDWDRGTPLNLKEARRLTTGGYSGQVEHKYDYSAILSLVPAYGWSSTKHRVGLWMVNPSMEYIGGGPTKVELTGHLDGNPGGAPTLLNMWMGSHYGGTSLAIGRAEAWTKVVGPFVIYCNGDADHEALWQDALKQARTESEKWPYTWVQDAAYPLGAGRGSLAGSVVIDDPGASASSIPQNIQVGLTPPDYQSSGRSGGTIGWQRDSKFYQFWTKADAKGQFALQNVRPGRYALRVFADGVLGEFAKTDIEVEAGETMDLGVVAWRPERFGRTLWEIGIPNRSAEEFRHGDAYWHWGLYLKYAEEFPNGVEYVVGKSDWRRDWNFAQPPRLSPDGRRAADSTWTIAFDLEEIPAGPVTLRLSFCGAREGCRIIVSANGSVVGDTGYFSENGVMHRDGIRGLWFERIIKFSPAHLKKGTNVIALRSKASSWHQGVLYDYLRLEAGDPPVVPKNL